MSKDIRVKHKGNVWRFAISNASMSVVHVNRREASNLRVYLTTDQSDPWVLVHTTRQRVAVFACGVLPSGEYVVVESDTEITGAVVCSDGYVRDEYYRIVAPEEGLE